MRFVNELRTGLSGGRGTGSIAISTRYDGLGINAQKFGGQQTMVGETNYSAGNKKIPGSGNY